MDQEQMKSVATRMTFESIEHRLDFQEKAEMDAMHEEQAAVLRNDFDAAGIAHTRRGQCLDRHMILLQIRDTKNQIERGLQ